jgi:site-specific DNA recombinase
MTDAIGYVRVSTAQQRISGVGIAAQEESIRRAARNHGYNLVRILRDEGVSGSVPLKSRPGGRELIRAIKSNPGTVILTYSLDRICRSTPDMFDVLAKLKTAKVGIRFINAGIHWPSPTEDLDDFQRSVATVVVTVLSAVANFERDLARARNIETARYLQSQGRSNNGYAPFGWNLDEGYMVPCSVEQRWLGRMIELRERGTSFRTIAKLLEDEGPDPKRGGAWHASTVKRILDRLDREDQHANKEEAVIAWAEEKAKQARIEAHRSPPGWEQEIVYVNEDGEVDDIVREIR